MSWFLLVSLALGLSVMINIFVSWYCIRLLRELIQVSDTIEDLFVDISSFSKHLQGVYELEMFYGDQTLENLLSHARVLTQEFDKYEDLFSLRDPLQPEEEDFDNEAETTQTKV